MKVIAEYSYTPVTEQDLELRKDEEYVILEMADTNWWRARDKYGWEDSHTPASPLKTMGKSTLMWNKMTSVQSRKVNLKIVLRNSMDMFHSTPIEFS